MTDKTYNGWTNYETWRVNLEIFHGWSADDLDSLTMGDDYQLAKQLKDYATEILESGTSGLVLDFALAFLDAADFRQIAQHMIEEHALNAKG